jgi:hypothetical protein
MELSWGFPWHGRRVRSDRLERPAAIRVAAVPDVRLVEESDPLLGSPLILAVIQVSPADPSVMTTECRKAGFDNLLVGTPARRSTGDTPSGGRRPLTGLRRLLMVMRYCAARARDVAVHLGVWPRHRARGSQRPDRVVRALVATGAVGPAIMSC